MINLLDKLLETDRSFLKSAILKMQVPPFQRVYVLINPKAEEKKKEIKSLFSSISVETVFVQEETWEQASEDEEPVFLDALFTTGYEDNGAELHLSRLKKRKVYSLLCPGQLNPLNGLSDGKYIVSDVTFASHNPYMGLFMNDGLDACHEVDVIGKEDKSPVRLSEEKDFLGLLGPRKRNLNKGSFGRAGIIGGSDKYFGAPYLSYLASSILCLGGGYAFLGIPEKNMPIYALKDSQLIIKPFPTLGGTMAFSEAYLDQFKDFSSLSFGMGLDVSKGVYDSLCYLIRTFKGTLIIDADGLNSLAAFGSDVLDERVGETILTPHIGEFSRLIKKPAAEVEGNSFSLGKEFVLAHHVCLVLKSASSLLTDGAETYISAFGNSGLAKAGSGDMLSGLLTGTSLYKDLPLLKRAGLACFLLGRAAEKAAQKTGVLSITYEDVLSGLKEACLSISGDISNKSL